jgi:hypothetical protein
MTLKGESNVSPEAEIDLNSAPPEENPPPFAMAIPAGNSYKPAPASSTASRPTTTTTTTYTVPAPSPAATGQVVNLTNLGTSPHNINCPYCQQSAVTRTRSQIDCFTITMIVILILLFWPLFWVPLVVPGCKTTEHVSGRSTTLHYVPFGRM